MSSKAIPSTTDPYDWYSALPLVTDSSIRLIRLQLLQSGETDDADLACEQRLYCLETLETLLYAALSYTWGNPRRDKPITHDVNHATQPEDNENDKDSTTGPRKPCKIWCTGRGLPITQNLYDFLISIRRKRLRGWFWADAICINQDDIPERDSQVLLMGPIYTKATTVLVWLGEADEYTQRAYTSIEYLSTVLKSHLTPEVKGLIQSLPIGDPAAWDALGTPKLTPQQWRAMGILLTRSWFTRAWTLQEAALSRRCQLWCGIYWLDNFDLRTVAEFLISSHWFKILFEAVEGYQLRGGILPPWAVLEGLNGVQEQAMFGVRDDNTIRRSNLQSMAAALYTMLNRPLIRQATDRRDFIYSLLSLALLHTKSSDDNTLKPDYSKPFQLVWAEATVFMIQELESLDILAHAQSSIALANGSENEEHAVTLDGLPSWVPLFHRKRRPYIKPEEFDAMGERKHVARIYRHPMLYVFGFQITEDLLVTRVARLQQFFVLSCFLAYAEVVTSVDFEQQYGQSCLQILLSIVRGNDYARAGPNLARDGTYTVQRDDKLIHLQVMFLLTYYRIFAEEPAAKRNPRMVDTDGKILPYAIWSFTRHYIDIHPGLAAKIFPDWGPGANLIVKAYLESISNEVRDDLFNFIQERLTAMSFFRLANTNILGAIYHDFRPNDQLWFLYGLNVPVVLRRRVAPGVFRLMGPAYVHGYMHGEILETAWAKEEREIALV